MYAQLTVGLPDDRIKHAKGQFGCVVGGNLAKPTRARRFIPVLCAWA